MMRKNEKKRNEKKKITFIAIHRISPKEFLMNFFFIFFLQPL